MDKEHLSNSSQHGNIRTAAQSSTPILGNRKDNQLSGGKGNDLIYGNGGSDRIDGGEGKRDTAGFSGSATDYRFKLAKADDTIQVINRKTGDIDTVTNVEFLLFGNERIKLANADISVTPVFVGEQGNSGVYEADLSDIGLQIIQSITIQDDNIISGGRGSLSGFDLDFVQLQDQNGQVVDLFDFSDQKVFFERGALQEWQPGDPEIWNQKTLNGTTDSGNIVDFDYATLDTLDAGLSSVAGMVSLGEGGQITFQLKRPIAAKDLSLVLGDFDANSGDLVGVEVSLYQNPDPLDGLTLFGTAADDNVNLRGLNRVTGIGYDLVLGKGGDDIIFSGRGIDRINGGTGDDVLLGNRNRDRLTGSSGDDLLRGKRGKDRLDGGSGNDVLIGGRGEDTFILNRGKGRSIIRDFSPLNDQIGLSDGIDFNKLSIDSKKGDVLISLNGDSLALLSNVRANQLTDNLFVEIG